MRAAPAPTPPTHPPTQIPSKNGEPLHILRYNPGEEYVSRAPTPSPLPVGPVLAPPARPRFTVPSRWPYVPAAAEFGPFPSHPSP
jgi:hypothetical protein